MSLLARITHRIGRFTLDLDLQLPGQGVSALFGPSGCGKTLTLRCLAGLERPAQAQIVWCGTSWQHGRQFLPPHRRRIGYVPQEAALFAHLDVRGNLEFARQRSLNKRLTLSQVTRLLGIEDLLDRRADSLSGGQRQRVAVARALLADPVLLLLDEPLSALDHSARLSIARDLRVLSRELTLPMILVSHSSAEVERLADRIVLMDAGRNQAVQDLSEALADPASPLQLEDGPAAVFDTRVLGASDDGLLEVELGHERLWLPNAALAPGGVLRLRIAAREVTLALTPAQDSSALNTLAVTIEALQSCGDGRVLVICRMRGGERLFAAITERARTRLALGPGLAAYAQFKATALPG